MTICPEERGGLVLNFAPSPTRPEGDAPVSRPSSDQPFLNWNLGPGDEASGHAADHTIDWRKVEPTPAPIGLAANFTLHRPGAEPEADPADAATLSPSALARAGAGETIDHGGRRPAPAVADAVLFPRKGDGIGGFRLVAELGRGAFGRVFLAEESGLGNRAVALKISQPEGDEPRILARLQHTHIVPIHSVHDDPETGLRLMCMPYFGGANLAEVLEAAGSSTAESGTTTGRGVGRSLIEALDLVGHPASAESSRTVGSAPVAAGDPPASGSSLNRSAGPPAEGDPGQPARRFLRQATSVRAAVWIAARLAEGLEHAHSRGLLHRDLKPSNILIAADGTPMLLDFNLATDAPNPDRVDKAMMGGTLPYMSPEHLDAFNPRGTTRPGTVDERSDLYGLGLILFEMIAGHPPFPGVPSGLGLVDAVATMTEQRRKPPPSLRAANPAVPWSLDAIVAKCLDPDPARRHLRAGDLAEDLRRFLDDQPLKFSPEPSLRETAAKWARRNPRMVGATPVAALTMALLALAGWSGWTVTRHLDRVSARLGHRLFQSRFQECQLLLNTTGGTTAYLNRGIGRAEEALANAGIEGRGRSWVDALPEAERDEAPPRPDRITPPGRPRPDRPG